MNASGLMQIGEAAERTGLSLRAIRYYEEVGLVVPSTRTQGGFRLYTEAHVHRLQMIKRMKPLDFTLEQTRQLLDIIDYLTARPPLPEPVRSRLLATLVEYRQAAQARCEVLREELSTAETFNVTLTEHIEHLGADATSPTSPATSATPASPAPS